MRSSELIIILPLLLFKLNFHHTNALVDDWGEVIPILVGDEEKEWYQSECTKVVGVTRPNNEGAINFVSNPDFNLLLLHLYGYLIPCITSYWVLCFTFKLSNTTWNLIVLSFRLYLIAETLVLLWLNYIRYIYLKLCTGVLGVWDTSITNIITATG